MYILGVDLGQAKDFTALSVLEIKSLNEYHVNHLERLELGTPYPTQISRITDLYNALKAMGKVQMIVDGTGVGRAVVDGLVMHGLTFTAAHITGGSNVSREGLYLRIPKRDLVASVAVLLQNKSLKISPSLALSDTLLKELLAFKVTFNARGSDSYGNDTLSWREAPHDDLVLSVALACWMGQKLSKKPEKVYSKQSIGNWRSGSGKHYPRNPKER